MAEKASNIAETACKLYLKNDTKKFKEFMESIEEVR